MILIGFIVMLATCSVTWLIGGPAERQGALFLAACWMVSLVGQAFLGGHNAIPLIIANVICGLGLLVLAYKHGKAWLWLTLLIQVVIIILHAMWTDDVSYVSYMHMATLNVLSLSTLAVLLMGGVGNAIKQRRFRATTPQLD